MSRYSREGVCGACPVKFRYFLLDARDNACAYAYCGDCGTTALLTSDGWPDDLERELGGPAPPGALARLAPCDCGGAFASNAAPRCPDCHAVVDPQTAAPWLERNRRLEGWVWQGNWSGPHAIVIENRLASDPWRR